jgi:hypothetical protein
MEDGTLKEKPHINAFHKASNAIIGDGDTMVLPDAPASVFEGEAELALVIGKRATRVPASDAMSYIFGYTGFIDGSARGLPPPGNVFFQMKSRDTFAPTGPWIVTADEIADPQNLNITLTNNGAVMQKFNTSDMAHHIPRCIEWLSSIHTLEPGDIVATGTNHRGLNPVHGRRQDRAHHREGRHAELQHSRRAQADLGAHHPPAAQGQRQGRPAHARRPRQVREQVTAGRAPRFPAAPFSFCAVTRGKARQRRCVPSAAR